MVYRDSLQPCSFRKIIKIYENPNSLAPPSPNLLAELITVKRVADDVKNTVPLGERDQRGERVCVNRCVRCFGYVSSLFGSC